MAATTPTLKRGLRIVALPLTAAPHPTLAHQQLPQLTYYHFLTPPPPTEQKQSLTKRTTAKAAQLWAALGKAEEGSWKRRAFLYGEKLIDRLEFEELSLKSLDTSLGPKLLHTRSAATSVPRDNEPGIPLIYPPSVHPSPLQNLRSLLEKRMPRHRRGCIVWMLVSPLTAPFMLIPIIPNFPFFFCIWRSWSHYRAYKASQYLEALLQRGAIHEESSPELDKIYANYSPEVNSKMTAPEPDLDSEASETPSGTNPPMPLLLTSAAVPQFAAHLEVPPDSTFAADMYRALEQSRLRLAGVRHS